MRAMRAGAIRRELYLLHHMSSRIFSAKAWKNKLFIVPEGDVQLENIAHVHIMSIANGYIARSIDGRRKLLLQRWIYVGEERLY